jgi:Kef-type K+ transport system membrane component KefB
MFIAGLELDLSEFRKNQYKSIVFGVLTFILPISIGLPVCYYLLQYPLSTSMLTASMFATHTLIAYPIVSRLGISKNESVAITVGGTILTDTAVLIILAVISGSHAGGLTPQLWVTLGASILIFLVVVVLVIPRIASWFFKRLEDEKNAHFIFVLSIVFFCAFLAKLSGLEPIIGAFAAGLTLNRLIPQSSSLMNRITFVGNSLFIPFFLISVGMLIDVRVLANGSQALIVAGALTVVALLGKWLASYFTGIFFKYSSDQRKLIFGLSSAHAAATLAVILVGYNIGIIDDNILNGTIVLILITCLVASFVTEEAGKRVAVHDEAAHPEHEATNVQRILVPISNPVTMERLIDFAIMIKEPRNYHPIVGLTVVEDDDQAQPKLLHSRKMLERAITHAASADQKIDITATIDQNVTSGIKRIAKEMFITDIIMGWPKTNIADFIFGKTFDSVVNQTVQHVFLVRFTLPLNIHKGVHILCPPLAEKEEGFYQWINRIARFSLQLSLRVSIHCGNETFSAIESYVRENKISLSMTFHENRDIANLSILKDKFHVNDIVILVSSRKASISYGPYLDVLPRRLTRVFDQNSVIFIYPEVSSIENLSSYTRETTGGLLEKGLDFLRGLREGKT